VRRIICDEPNLDAKVADDARTAYEQAIKKVVQGLAWQDFELLIDLILARTGWIRRSELGKTLEGIDIEAENISANEIAFVQVKSVATQQTLDDYIKIFADRRELYARMIFAVHSPRGELRAPIDTGVQVWTGDRLARLVVRSGLGEWVERKLR
jgi:hypothetical protein